jgi:hypothetical protein
MVTAAIPTRIELFYDFILAWVFIVFTILMAEHPCQTLHKYLNDPLSRVTKAWKKPQAHVGKFLPIRQNRTPQIISLFFLTKSGLIIFSIIFF